MTSIGESAAAWPPAAVSARLDPAVLLMGFAGAHRRSELVALTLADVTLHPTDGLHVRGAAVEDPTRGGDGTVRALPDRRDPVTYPPARTSGGGRSCRPGIAPTRTAAAR